MQKHILLTNSRFIWVTALLLICNVAFAQMKVTGIVTDPSGEPVIGANVLVKETSMGAITDLDGHFTVNAPENGSLVDPAENVEIIANIREMLSTGIPTFGICLGHQLTRSE